MADVRVSTIELFFDLVFVFTITQLTTLLVAEPTGVGVGRVVLIFGNVWWMYGGYAWLTNAVPPREPVVRLLMLVGMAGFLIVALAIPLAFGSSGLAIGVGYLVVTFVHTGLFLRASQESAVRAMFRLGPYNVVTAAMLLAAGFVGGPARWALWTAAFVLHWASPAVTAVGGFRIRAGHFVERHGLIVLIALGESVVAVGLGVQGHHELTAGLILTAVLGLALAAVLWWLYFDGEDQWAERALDEAPDTRNPWLALFAFGYAFLPVLGGIIVLAAGVREGHRRLRPPGDGGDRLVPRRRHRRLRARLGPAPVLPPHGLARAPRRHGRSGADHRRGRRRGLARGPDGRADAHPGRRHRHRAAPSGRPPPKMTAVPCDDGETATSRHLDVELRCLPSRGTRLVCLLRAVHRSRPHS
jgi:low temperature requirement protein LtrA